MANNLKGITVQIGADTAPLNKALEGVNKTSRSLQNELKEVEKGLKLDPKSTELVAQKQKLLAESISNTKAKLETLRTAEKQVQQQFLDGKIGEEQYRALQREIISTNKNLNNLEKQAKESNSELTKVSEVSNKVAKGADNVASKTAPATLGILGMGVASAKTAMDFEDGLAKISTIADTTQLSMKDISDGVLKLSNDTGESVDILNDGLYEAISSGVQTGDTLKFMGTASKAAIGGFTDTNTAVDGLTTVMNAYGLSAKDANNIANQMMVTQNLGKTTFGELSQTIGNAIPTFASADVSTKEFFSSLSVLTANGIKTSEAVSGMKAALSNIIKPSVQASQAADSLGLKFNSAELKSKGWMPFLQEVKDKLKQCAPEYEASTEKVAKLTARQEELAKAGKKSSKEYKDNAGALKLAKTEMNSLEGASTDQLTAFSTMFGSVEGLNSVLTLTSDQGVKLYNTSMEQMGGKTDYVNDAFKKIKGTSGSTFKDTLNDVKNLSITLGQQLLPILKPILQHIIDLVSHISKMSPEGKKTMLVILGLVAAISPVAKLISGISTVVGGATKAFDALKNITKLHTIAQTALNLVMSLNPIALVIIAIVALIATGVILYNKCTGFRNFINAMWAEIKQLFTGVIVPFFQGFVGIFVGIGSTIWNTITGIFSNVKNIFSNFIDFFKNVFTGNWEGAWQNIVNIFDNIFSGIGKIFKLPINVVIGGINGFLGGLNKIKIPDWVPDVGGKGFSIPKIPMLAKGTNYFGGGYAIVGEKGAELVKMPRGAEVIPHNKTIDMLNNGQGTNNNVVNNTYGSILHTDKIILSNDVDVEVLSKKLEFIRQNTNIATGGV